MSKHTNKQQKALTGAVLRPQSGIIPSAIYMSDVKFSYGYYEIGTTIYLTHIKKHK